MKLGSRAAHPLLNPDSPPANSSLATSAAANDLSAGIEVPHWFVNLPTGGKNTLAKACLQVLDNRVTDPRESWLRVLFALGDAERLGCTGAQQLALEWSRQGASWNGEADFEMAWRSCKAKSGGVTIGTLLSLARDSGLDVSPWRPVLARPAAQGAHAAFSGASLPKPPQPPRAINIAGLPNTPRKRQWLHGTDLVRGAVSLLVAPGGRGKRHG